eukprot:sb/3464631/
MVGILASAMAPNKWVFLAARTLTGACIGVNYGPTTLYATEFAESKYRVVGMAVMVMSAFSSSATVNLLAYFLLNTIGWRWFILVVSIPIIPALVLTAILPESPRYLCVSGKVDELKKALSFMARLNNFKLDDDVEVVVYQNEELGSYSMLFNETNKRTVISLSVAYSANIFLGYGLIVFPPLFFSSKYCGTATIAPEHRCQMLTQEDLWNLSLSSGAAIIGGIVGFLSASYIGRVIPLRVGNFAVLACLLALLICINHFITFTTVSLLKLTDATVNTLLLIVPPEAFATCLRATAIGFIQSWGKLGGVFGLVRYSYHYLHLTHGDAQNFCSSRGGNLACPQDAIQQARILDTIRGNSWLGVVDVDEDGVYRCLGDNTITPFTNWYLRKFGRTSRPEPDNMTDRMKPGASYVQIIYDPQRPWRHGKWIDRGAPQYEFVVKSNFVCENPVW